jgi:vacuolar-type H+-ATPase subunit F/Vma7
VGRLAVITTADLAPGYRLAGATTFDAPDAAQAAALVRRLLSDHGDVQVIALHEPWLEALDRATRRAVDERILPLVIGLPVGADPEAAEHRRARLARMMHGAVGYRISFRPEAS